MTPVLTITDASTAFTIAEALRSQADANRRVADRLSSPAYFALSTTTVRQAARLVGHAQRLDNLATEAERQGHAAMFGDDAPTVILGVVL
jgi:hypothetical protein